MLAVCVVHEVVVAQKLGPRDWLALAEASLAGNMTIMMIMNYHLPDHHQYHPPPQASPLSLTGSNFLPSALSFLASLGLL